MRKLLNSELKRLTIEEFKTASKIPLVVVLDDVRSLNNIGSVFRTGDAFLVEGIHLCGITAIPPHREIQKTALGATETVKWQYFNDIQQSVGQLKSEGYKIYAIEQVDDSISLNKFTPYPTDKIAVILGNEIKGVSDLILSQIHGSIEIPQFGTKHSLNISVCAGIVIWHFFLHMRK
ncbi:MAG: RNA methyltransferase [Bacteroidetes bacterium]|nr:RNA methyltransferase [Bacteroidota bacterium]